MISIGNHHVGIMGSLPSWVMALEPAPRFAVMLVPAFVVETVLFVKVYLIPTAIWLEGGVVTPE